MIELRITLTVLLVILRTTAFCQEKAVIPPAEKADSLAEIGFERHFVEVKDATISYALRKRAGPTLVLVPGSFDSAESWLGVVANLNHAIQVAIVELRGHGQSWPPPTVHSGSIEQFAKDVLACTDDARLRSFYIGGHSIGGMVAIECARQQPDLIRGVLSIEGWTRSSVLGAAFKARTDSTLSDLQKQRKFELRRPTSSRWTKEQLSAFAQIWQHWDGTEILEQTSLPVLELWGDRGDSTRPSRSVMRIPSRANIDLVWVPGASHFLPLERPKETAAAVNEFVRKTESKRP